MREDWPLVFSLPNLEILEALADSDPLAGAVVDAFVSGPDDLITSKGRLMPNRLADACNASKEDVMDRLTRLREALRLGEIVP